MYINCHLIKKNQMQKERKCWLRYSREPSKDKVFKPRSERWEGKSRKALRIQADRSVPRSSHIDYSPHQPPESDFDPLRLRHTPRGPVIQEPPFPTLPVVPPASAALEGLTSAKPSRQSGTVSSETLIWITNGSQSHHADFYLVINLLKH